MRQIRVSRILLCQPVLQLTFLSLPENSMAFQYPPVKSYFDAASCDAEVKFAFGKGLRYAGHTLMVPEKFSYFTLPHLHDRYVLFN